MRYVMTQKLFSWADSFVIRDDQEQEVYRVEGRVFSLGKQLSFQDMEGRELAFIRQRLLSFGPTYEIHHGGELVATVKKALFTLLHCRFTVDVPGPDDLEARGEFLDHEYTFTRSGRPVAAVTKQWLSWTDTYGVEVEEGQDPVLILASAVVIDLACHENHHG
ncbi:MAG TPA: LURP-one-related family protein [Armatimonadota bacterium]|jgi:uncharacterized protein YxjI